MQLIDLSTLPVAWNQVGTIPPIMQYPGGNTNPYACIVNGYFSLFYPLFDAGNQKTGGAVLFSFDGLGGMCIYHSSDYSPKGTQTSIASAFDIWQNNNTFIYTLDDGTSWKFIAPTVFSPNTTYTLPAIPLLTPSPCGSGDFSKTIFCSGQGIYCYEFIQPFPLSDNFWASAYDKTGGFIGGGYLGNSATDPFDLRNLTLPPLVNNHQIYDRNGLVVFGNFSSAGPSDQVVGSSQSFLNGDITKLFCGGVDPNNPVFVTQKNPSQIYYSRDYGMPGFATASDAVISGITDAPGNILFPDAPIKMLSNAFYIQLPTHTNRAPSGYLSKKKQLFQAAIGFDWSQAYPVYMASLDLSPYGPAPQATRSDFSGLANYHRVISPTGQYQA